VSGEYACSIIFLSSSFLFKSALRRVQLHQLNWPPR
jgi:hypothetical protein